LISFVLPKKSQPKVLRDVGLAQHGTRNDYWQNIGLHIVCFRWQTIPGGTKHVRNINIANQSTNFAAIYVLTSGVKDGHLLMSDLVWRDWNEKCSRTSVPCRIEIKHLSQQLKRFSAANPQLYWRHSRIKICP
jgi:hypothetical protein